jgi:hypothetical protein
MLKGLEDAIDAGMAELKKKSLRVIQTDTAIKWLGRAVAAVKLGKTDDAHEYAHEALEHAALSDKPTLITDVRAILRKVGVKP